MATRQTNKKPSSRKKPTKKKAGTGSGIYVAIGAVGLLLILVVTSLYFLINGNNESVNYVKNEDKKEVSSLEKFEKERAVEREKQLEKEKQLKKEREQAAIDAEKKRLAEIERQKDIAKRKEIEAAKIAERERIENTKKEQARLEREKLDNIRKAQELKEEELNAREKRLQEERKKDSDSKNKAKKEPTYIVNIEDEIKNVLFDNEISKSSVKKDTFVRKNVVYTTLDIQCHDDMSYILSKALEAIFVENDYEIRTDNQKSKTVIYARNKKDNYIVSINNIEQANVVAQNKKETKKDNKKKKDSDKVVKNDAVKSDLPIPPVKSNKQIKIGILLDDGGNSIEVAKQYVKLKYPVAIAILPHLEHTKAVAKMSKDAGKTIFLHFPMAPKSYPKTDPGEGAITPTMPTLLISGIAEKNFKSLGVKVDGFNNHMGSAITEDTPKMKEIFRVSREYTINFIDSRTTPKSVAYKECKLAGYKCGENKIFLDNDNDIKAIISKIYEAADKARKQGDLIVIGHIRTNTIKALEIAIPELEKRNYKIVNLTSLLH